MIRRLSIHFIFFYILVIGYGYCDIDYWDDVIPPGVVDSLGQTGHKEFNEEAFPVFEKNLKLVEKKLKEKANARIVLHSDPDTGKSTLLKLISNQINSEKGRVALNIDCSFMHVASLENEDQAQRISKLILNQFIESCYKVADQKKLPDLKRQLGTLNRNNFSKVSTEIHKAIEIWKSAGFEVTFIVDEGWMIEEFADDFRKYDTGSQLIQDLNSVVKNKNVSILSTQPKIPILSQDLKRVIGHRPLIDLFLDLDFNEVKLGSENLSSLKKYLSKVGAKKKIKFSPAAAEFLLKASAGKPSAIQFLIKHIDPAKIQNDMVEINDIARSVSSALNHPNGALLPLPIDLPDIYYSICLNKNLERMIDFNLVNF